MKRGDTPHYTDHSILDAVKADKTGSAFSARDFLKLGTHAAVRKALERLTKNGELRRIRRGFYDRPRPHPVLGQTATDPMELVRSVMKTTGAQWQVSGAYAANQLHLTEQVPAKIGILTNGVPRKISLGKLTLDFRRAAPRNLLGAGKTSGLVFQALRYLGKDQVSPEIVARLQRQLDPTTKQDLAKVAPQMPAWLRPVVEQIAAP
jgi:predicted transcriptional regulator of viral defense system